MDMKNYEESDFFKYRYSADKYYVRLYERYQSFRDGPEERMNCDRDNLNSGAYFICVSFKLTNNKNAQQRKQVYTRYGETFFV